MSMKFGLLPKRADPTHSAAKKRRETLRDFFDDVYASPAEFLVFDDGYRSWRHSYEQVRGAVKAL